MLLWHQQLLTAHRA